MFIHTSNDGVKTPSSMNRSSVSFQLLNQTSQQSLLVAFDNEPLSEITCPNCDEPCADERCPNCGAIVWHPGHQISGGSL